MDETIIFWCVAGGFFLLGAYVFRKLQPQFADLV
jgi:ABC-type polysaccharide/polyol phosphate export permease